MAFVFLGGLYLELCSALLCLTINSFPYMKIFASSVTELSRKQKTFQNCFWFYLGTAPSMAAVDRGFSVAEGTTVPKEPG